MQDQRAAYHEKSDHADEYLDLSRGLLVSRSLGDGDPLIRKHSLYFLSMARNPEDISTFIQALRDPEKQVRSQATRALAMVGEPVVRDLIVLLRDPDWRVRYRAAEALGLINTREARDRLIQCLSDNHDHVRYMAVKALGQLKDQEILDSLRACLQDDNPYVRKITSDILDNCPL